MAEICDIWTCPACASSADVSMLGLYARVTCPQCGQIGRAHETVGHFRITGVLGIGGMSVVYKARDLVLGRDLAIKVLKESYRSQPERMARFERECALMAKVRHHNVVALYSAGWLKNQFYIAMELIEGANLEDKLHKEGRGFPPMEALSIVRQAAEGLRAASIAGMLHRDMKPGNILLTPSGEAKVLDFGLSLESSDEKSNDGVIWATPFYVPPETLRMEPEDIRSDIYALGMTLRSLLTGETQFVPAPRGVTEILKAKQRLRSMMRMAPRKPLSRHLRLLVDRMTAIRAADRPSSYDELLQELDSVMVEQEGVARGEIGFARRFGIFFAFARYAVPALVGVSAAFFSYRWREAEREFENRFPPLSPDSDNSLRSFLSFRTAVEASRNDDLEQAAIRWEKLAEDGEAEPALRAYAAVQLFVLGVVSSPHCSAGEAEGLWSRVEEHLPEDRSVSPAGRAFANQCQRVFSLLALPPSKDVIEKLMQASDALKLPCLLYAASQTEDRELFSLILTNVAAMCEGETLSSLYGRQLRDRMMKSAEMMKKPIAATDLPREEAPSEKIFEEDREEGPATASALKLSCERSINEASESERALLLIRLEALELIFIAQEALKRHFPEIDFDRLSLEEAELFAQRVPCGGRFSEEFKTLVLIAQGRWEESMESSPYKSEPESQAPFAVLSRDWFQRRTAHVSAGESGAGNP